MTDQDSGYGLDLTGDDVTATSLLVLRMMTADVAVDRAARGRVAKLRALDTAVDRLAAELAVVPAAASAWRRELGARLASAPDHAAERIVLERAGDEATRHVPTRDRQLAVLIELTIANPWPTSVCWSDKARERSLVRIVQEFDALEPDDRTRVQKSLIDALRRLRRSRPSSLKRKATIAAVGVVGVGVGVATMGAAAPAVGAVIGGTMFGLSGAAATSAGLAALGGGALAAGGFGMAGGATLLAGFGALAGGGLLAGGARAASLRWGAVAVDAVRLELHTVIITLGEQRDDEQARRVAVLLRRRLDEVTVRLIEIASRLQEERETNSELRDTLEKERDRAILAEEALRNALDRLAEAGVDIDVERDVEGTPPTWLAEDAGTDGPDGDGDGEPER